MIAMFRDPDGEWVIPLTLRPFVLQHHGGQISLPGGRIESGESPMQAALREFHEELGVVANVQRELGELSKQYVYASNNVVYSFVVEIEAPAQPWHPDPTEVAEVVMLPLETLCDPRHRHVMTQRKALRKDEQLVDEIAFSASAIQCGSHRIWGATAMILDELAEIAAPALAETA